MCTRKELKVQNKLVPRAQITETKHVFLECETGWWRHEREMRLALEVVEAGVGGVADAGEVLVPFSQVLRVVSAAIGSRFWQLQEDGSSDEDDIILAEVAVESKAKNRPTDFSDDVSKTSQDNGVQSSISSSFHRSLQVGGRGALAKGLLRRFQRICFMAMLLLRGTLQRSFARWGYRRARGSSVLVLVGPGRSLSCLLACRLW